MEKIDIFKQPYSDNNFKKIIEYYFNDPYLEVCGDLLPIENIKINKINTQITYFGKLNFDKEDLIFLSIKVENLKAKETQRKAIQNYLKSGAFNYAIVAFYTDKKDWRFSFVEINKGKTQYKKSYSFLVGTSHIKTLKMQLDIYNRQVKIENIKQLFNKESLNKNFYKKIEGWYDEALKDIKIDLTSASKVLNKKIDIELKPQVVIRIITRMMFIWFMKEKDNLIPNELFDEKNILNILKEEDVYYNCILQNLFFATLNCEQSEREWAKGVGTFDTTNNSYGIKINYRYKDKFKNPDDFIKLVKDIPYINGGLFTCHDNKISGKDNKETNYILDGFTNIEKDRLKISDRLFFGSNGLVTIFNDYNFTIEENTPTEEMIALDPELLGTIFENLIAMYNPETSGNARKSSGSYYTPKDIVDYMCSETLKETLKTKLPNINIESLFTDEESKYNYQEEGSLINAIINLKIIDPACGSGAFPIGMLNLMLRTIEKLNCNKTAYKNKLDIITKCIYGVDIQNIAIEITKLRLFISLLVDMDTDKTKKNYAIEVLPNLETKFIVANSLVGLDLQTDITLFKDELFKGYEKLKEIFEPYVKAKTPTEKRILKENFEKQKSMLITTLKENNAFPTDIAKIGEWDPFNVCYCSPFFDKSIMYGVSDGFDILIGNPPYIQLQKIKDVPYIKQIGGCVKSKRKRKQTEDNSYSVYEATGDIYCLFYEKGISTLKEKGHLCFITSNKWMRAGYGEKLREYLSKNNPKILIDLGGNVFENATVDTNILLIQKIEKKTDKEQKTICYSIKDRSKKLSDLIIQDGEQITFTDGHPWTILNPIERSIKEKIEKIGTPLKDWKDIKIYRGVLTGCNEAFIIDEIKRNEILNNCKTEEERIKTAEIIRPILRGRDIKRYGYEWANLYLILTHNGYNKIPRIEIEEYPSIKKHLDNHIDKITKRDDKGDTPYNLRSCAYMEEFFKPKIVYGEISQNAHFYLDNGNFFIDATGYLMTSKYLNYLLHSLNSKLLEWTFKTNYTVRLGKNGFRYQKAFIEKLPIMLPTTEIENNLEKSINKDDFIYNLYGLNEKEISIIEKQIADK